MKKHQKKSSKIFAEDHCSSPFVASLASNLPKIQNYNKVIKAQDNITEKQNISKENWRLKQLFRHLSLENKIMCEKLKKSNFSHLDPDQNSLKIVNFNKEANTLHSSIFKLHQELEKISAENQEMEKRLTKKISKFTIEISPVKDQASENLQISEKIQTLDSEIEALSKKIQKLHKKNVGLEILISQSTDFLKNTGKVPPILSISHESSISLSKF